MIFVRESFSDSNRQGGDLCSICNVPLREGDRAIDTGIHIDFEGTFEFCESCFRDMAKDLGWVSPADHAEAVSAAVVNAQEVEVAWARIEQQRAVIETLSEEVAYAALERAGRWADSSTEEPTVVTEEPDFSGAPDAA